MIIGIGVDVCDIGRWREMVARRPRAVDRLLTPAEAALNHVSQAGRFAAKEALAKALGAPGGLGWQDAEVIVDEIGRPSFRMSGTVAERAASLGVTHVHLSITHDSGIASAFVICEAR